MMIKKIQAYWKENLPQTGEKSYSVCLGKNYDENEYKRYNVYHKYLPKIAEFDKYKGKKILEVGMGFGTDILQYAKNGSIVTGIDLTHESVKIVTERFKLKGLKGDFRQANAESLPFEDNTFDLVYSVGVLHHTVNTKEAIEEIRRVLKPKGKAIIMLYARGLKYIHSWILLKNLMPKSKRSPRNELWGSPVSIVFRKKQVRDMFSEFSSFKMEVHRLAIFFDFPGNLFGFNFKFSDWFVSLLYKIKAERVLGETRFITAVK